MIADNDKPTSGDNSEHDNYDTPQPEQHPEHASHEGKRKPVSRSYRAVVADGYGRESEIIVSRTHLYDESGRREFINHQVGCGRQVRSLVLLGDLL